MTDRLKSLKKGLLKKVGSTSDGPSVHSTIGEDVEQFYDASEAMLHNDAHDEGGLGFTNKELLSSQRSAIVEVGKDLGRKMLTGSFSLINLSVPVKMFEPRSYLQKLADVWVYPRLLERAVAAKDPVERLQWTVTWFVAGLQHVFQSWKKPFNPLLGETWQAEQPGGGCRIFLEQISHHPPISAFEMIGPRGAYVFSGHSQPDVQFKANTIKTTAKGYRCIEFADNGTKIDIQYPAYNMKGILYSDMPRGDMSGTTRFTDHTNGLCCELHFGKVEGADLDLLRRPDTITGSIFRTPSAASAPTQPPKSLKASSIGGLFGRGGSSDEARETGPALTSCVGNWLSHLDWDGLRRWTLVEEQPETWQPVKDPLPSDCRFRLDLATLKEGDQPGAQAAKEALENRQRMDAKYRKEAGIVAHH